MQHIRTHREVGYLQLRVIMKGRETEIFVVDISLPKETPCFYREVSPGNFEISTIKVDTTGEIGMVTYSGFSGMVYLMDYLKQKHNMGTATSTLNKSDGPLITSSVRVIKKKMANSPKTPSLGRSRRRTSE